MDRHLRLKFSELMSQSEFETAVDLIKTCGVMHAGNDFREFVVVAYPSQFEVLERFLSVWREDGLLTVSESK